MGGHRGLRPFWGVLSFLREPGHASGDRFAGAGEAEFRMLAVSPMARGRGLGEALVRLCIDRAREDACTTLRLSTEPVMHAAHRIYRRLGFVRTPDRDWSPAKGV